MYLQQKKTTNQTERKKHKNYFQISILKCVLVFMYVKRELNHKIVSSHFVLFSINLLSLLLLFFVILFYSRKKRDTRLNLYRKILLILSYHEKIQIKNIHLDFICKNSEKRKQKICCWCK